MGLAERRISAACQKDNFPGWKEKIEAVAGYPLDFEVSWDELVKPGFLEHYPQTLDYNFFEPLHRSLQSICRDDMGKEALREKIRRIRITSQRSWTSLEARVEGDCLHLDADPSYERSDAAIEAHHQITKVLEDAL
jgi:hypothetical protein